MTKQEQINFIKQKSVEANPDIKKLEFGCSINRPYNMYRYGGIIIGEDNGSYYVMYDSISQEIITMHDIQDDEILGRDIRLADILYAINTHGISNNEFWHDNTTEFYISKMALKWNLLKDNLNDQSDECVEFIYNLLK